MKEKQGEKAEQLETNKCKNLERAGNGRRAPSFSPQKLVGLKFKDEIIRENIHGRFKESKSNYTKVDGPGTRKRKMREMDDSTADTTHGRKK